MSEHTPSTPDVETRYIRFRQLEADLGADGVTPHQPGEFKRWYEAEVRKAKAEAWREGHDDGWTAHYNGDDLSVYRNPYRADQMEDTP